MAYQIQRKNERKSLASDLRHLINIQSYQPSSDGEGGMFDAWGTVKTTYAAINPIRANQRQDYDSISSDVTHIVKVRGNIACNAEQRILFGVRSFEVLTVEDIQERDIVKIITCKELSR